MSTCQNCSSNRIVEISAHSKDLNVVEWHGREHEGYLPYISGVCGDDDLEIALCLECGQIQGTWPKNDPDFGDDDDDWDDYDEDVDNEENEIIVPKVTVFYLRAGHFSKDTKVIDQATSLEDMLNSKIKTKLKNISYHLSENEGSLGGIIFNNKRDYNTFLKRIRVS